MGASWTGEMPPEDPQEMTWFDWALIIACFVFVAATAGWASL